MRAPALLAATFGLLALGACNGNDDKEDDTGIIDDTGDTTPDYESGCILVDGGGGYAHLADAMEVADAGSTIELCEGTMDELLVIDKSVNLVGPGTADLFWTAPTNQPAIRVQGASNVTVSGMTITSSRNGLEVEGSTGVTLSDIVFTGVANTAIRVTDSTGVEISGMEFAAPQYGGVEVSGGDARVADSIFAAPLGFAVHAIEDAVVTVAGNTISDVIYTEPGEDGVSDGFALWATDGATLITDGNDLTNNFVHVLTDQADIDLNGDTMTGGLYGVFSALGEQSFTDVTITDPYVCGIRAISPDPVTMTGVSVTADPELVDTEEMNWDNFTGGGVTVATDATFTADGLTITGFNNNGLLVLGYQNTPTVDITDLTISNTARRALSLFSAQGTLVNASVSDTRLGVDPSEITGNYNSQSPGLTVGIWSGNIAWTGGGITNSADMGAINFSGSLTLDGVTIAGNANYGIWNYQGSLFATNSTFSAASALGGLVNRLGDMILDGNTFIDNHESSIYSYEVDDGSGTGSTYTRTTETTNYSQDIVCYEHNTCSVLNNTFSDGSRGIAVQAGTEALIEGNTFTDYHSYVLAAYSHTDGSVEVRDNEMTNVGAYPIRCSSSQMELEDLTISGVTGAATEYITYNDGVEDYRLNYTTSSQAIYSTSCSLTISDSEIFEAAYHALYASDTSLEIYDLAVHGGSESGSTSYGAVRAYYSSAEPYVLISGLDVDGNDIGDGLQVVSQSSLAAGTVLLDGVNVSDPANNGVTLQNIQDATLTSVSASGAGAHGLSSTTSTFTMSGGSLLNNGGYGAWIEAAAGAVSVTETVARGNGNGGIYLSNTEATVTDNVVDSNTGYGLTCDGTVTLAACSDNDLSNNTDGEHDGCEDTCAAE
ncbi:MAG: right-handed parallel beta-helix repeat-containing protein [Alphaproteobacteria bacterium]|nr:right-handed parallel beta-helix repeat-containing protein [Alphaproteobacteria bacterium]